MIHATDQEDGNVSDATGDRLSLDTALPNARREFLKLAGIAVASQAFGHGNAANTETNAARAAGSAKSIRVEPQVLPSGYNILFVLTDQERYFEEWPFPVPGREMLRRTGVTFTNHQIASSVCSPSRSTIYTGLHPQHTGVFDNTGFPWQPDMSQEIRTIGDMLHDVGYHAAYLGKWHLSDSMQKSGRQYDAPVSDYYRTMQGFGFDDYYGPGDMIGGGLGGYRYDGLTTESAISWLRTRALELGQVRKPWVLAVNLVNPHDVMYVNTDPAGAEPADKAASLLRTRRPPDDDLYRARWTQVPLPPSRRQPLDERGRPAAHRTYGAAHGSLLGSFEFSDERLRIYQDYYFNCIRDCDTHVERLLRALELQGLASNTIVVFTSDHGEYGGHHQMVDKGASAYRQQNHVPLIIRHPAYAGGRRCSALTSHLDIAPTLLGMTGIDARTQSKVAGPSVKGRDFSQLLSNPAAADVNAIRSASLFNYAMLLYHDSDWMREQISTQRNAAIPKDQLLEQLRKYQPNLGFRGAIRSVFDGRVRFSRYFAYTNFNQPTTLEEILSKNDVELFDLKNDPEEMQNLALDPAAHGDLILHMNRSLNERIATEVGEDTIDLMPIRNGRVQLHVD